MHPGSVRCAVRFLGWGGRRFVVVCGRGVPPPFFTHPQARLQARRCEARVAGCVKRESTLRLPWHMFGSAGDGNMRAGYCGVTEGGTNEAYCEKGAHGAFPRVSNLRSCIARCLECSRCAFVSYSKRFDDCSWYSTCNETKSEIPEQPPGAGAQWFVTVKVKELRGDSSDCVKMFAPPAAAMPANVNTLPVPVSFEGAKGRLRFGIATLFYRHHDRTGADDCLYECGLLGWCAAAKRLQLALPARWRTSLLLVSAPQAAHAGKARGGRRPCWDLPRDCAGLSLLTPPQPLLDAVGAHVTHGEAASDGPPCTRPRSHLRPARAAAAGPEQAMLPKKAARAPL